MLRESSRIDGNKIDLHVITSGTETTGGVPAEKELIAFAEAALGDDGEAISSARESVKDACGEEAMVDAAGVIANFQRMVRIADGTGIPLDAPMAMVTVGMRENLGLNSFGSADNTPDVSFPKRILGALLGNFLPFMFRGMAKSAD